MTSRQLPDIAALRSLVKLQAPSLRRNAAAVARAATIEDLRAIARRRTPLSVFDYVDGAAESELSLTRARQAYADVEFHPRVLRDVGHIDLSCTILGKSASMPIVLAPTGFTRMMQYQGERAVAPAAARAGVPYTLSTMGTVGLEEVAAIQPTGERWFQLYLMQDRRHSEALVQRAREANYDTIVLTVDTQVAGERLRDVRNGLTIPPALTPKTLADMARHPSWWLNLLTTEALEFASLSDSDGTVAELVDRMFDPSLTPTDIDWLRERWDGKIIVKGIQHPKDAAMLAEIGVDGIVVSNHGGRQLDRSITPLLELPKIAEAVQGRMTILVDTGVMHGGDVVAARAAGADAVMIGRVYLYGLMAGGEAGVTRALEILRSQMRRTMALVGATTWDELETDHVRLPSSVTMTQTFGQESSRTVQGS